MPRTLDMSSPLAVKWGYSGGNTVAEKHLIEAIGKKYAAMSRGVRIATIRNLSQEGAVFMQDFFPKFYAEAFPEPSRVASGSWESDSRPALCAKSR
jgi:hypothetical protein